MEAAKAQVKLYPRLSLEKPWTSLGGSLGVAMWAVSWMTWGPAMHMACVTSFETVLEKLCMEALVRLPIEVPLARDGEGARYPRPSY